jgi:hypothetical protein
MVDTLVRLITDWYRLVHGSVMQVYWYMFTTIYLTVIV